MAHHSLKHVLPALIPDYLTHNETSHGIKAGRKFKFLEFPNAPFTSTHRIMRLEFPRMGHYDFKRCYLTFEALATSVGGTYVRFPDGIWNAIDNIRVLVGNQEIDHLRSYGLYQSEMWEFGRISNSGLDGTLGYSCFGIGNGATRSVWGAAGRKYAIPLNVGFLLSKVIDFKSISQMVVIEITLGNPSAVLESDGATLNYSFNNVELHTEELTELPEMYLSRVRALGGIHYAYTTWDEYISDITTTSRTIDIPHVSQSIHGTMTIMRNLADINDPTVNDKFKIYNYNNCNEIQFRINHKYYPERPIDTTVEALELYMELMKFLGHWEGFGTFTNITNVNAAQFVAGKYAIAIDFDEHPYHYGSMILNDFKLDHGNTFQLMITLNAPPAVAQQIHTFVLHHRVVTISPSGKVSTIK